MELEGTPTVGRKCEEGDKGVIRGAIQEDETGRGTGAVGVVQWKDCDKVRECKKSKR